MAGSQHVTGWTWELYKDVLRTNCILKSTNYIEIAWRDHNMSPVGLGNSIRMYKDVYGHRVIDITNGHFIHVGPLEETRVSIYKDQMCPKIY